MDLIFTYGSASSSTCSSISDKLHRLIVISLTSGWQQINKFTFVLEKGHAVIHPNTIWLNTKSIRYTSYWHGAVTDQ